MNKCCGCALGVLVAPSRLRGVALTHRDAPRREGTSTRAVSHLSTLIAAARATHGAAARRACALEPLVRRKVHWMRTRLMYIIRGVGPGPAESGA